MGGLVSVPAQLIAVNEQRTLDHLAPELAQHVLLGLLGAQTGQQRVPEGVNLNEH